MIGEIGEGEWIGHELLLENHDYVVNCISKSQVSLLKIKLGHLSELDDLLNNEIRNNALHEMEWINERMQNIDNNSPIKKFSKKIINLHENTSWLENAYPRASYSAIKAFQRMPSANYVTVFSIISKCTNT